MRVPKQGRDACSNSSALFSPYQDKRQKCRISWEEDGRHFPARLASTLPLYRYDQPPTTAAACQLFPCVFHHFSGFKHSGLLFLGELTNVETA